MHSYSSVLIGVFALGASHLAGAAPIAVTDDIGRKVELSAPARRIVTLAPFLTELAFAAGAGERVVGVSAHSDFPPDSRARPQVSSAAGFAIEPIMAQRPDLALVWKDSVRADELARLEALGIATFVAQARTLDDVPRLLQAVGRLVGGDASAPVAAYRAKLASLRATYAARPRIAVLLEIWHRPLTTVAGAHWMNEALAVCGASNAFADLPGVAPLVSWEHVYARDPAVIVGAGSAPSAEAFRGNWKARGTLSAVRAHRLVFVHGDLIQRPTPRLAEGVAQLCRGLDEARGRITK